MKLGIQGILSSKAGSFSFSVSSTIRASPLVPNAFIAWDLTLLLAGASGEEVVAVGGHFCDWGGDGTFLLGTPRLRADPETPGAPDFCRSAFSLSFLSSFSWRTAFVLWGGIFLFCFSFFLERFPLNRSVKDPSEWPIYTRLKFIWELDRIFCPLLTFFGNFPSDPTSVGWLVVEDRQSVSFFP